MIASKVLPPRKKLHQDSLSATTPTVFVVDSDAGTEKVVREVVDGYRLDVQLHTTGRSFFAAYDGSQHGCLVLELRIPDASGIQIQRQLAERNQRLPTVFVTSSIDVSTAVALMREGAVHVLEKPLRSIELLNAIQEALAVDVRQRQRDAEDRWVRDAVALLTYKERSLIGLTAAARSTKAIAEHLSISARAVELRRRRIMDKLGFGSSVELMRFALLAHERLGGMSGSPYDESAEI